MRWQFSLSFLLYSTVLIAVTLSAAAWSIRPELTQRLLWIDQHDVDVHRLQQSLESAKPGLPVYVRIGDELVPVNAARVNNGTGTDPSDDHFEIHLRYE